MGYRTHEDRLMDHAIRREVEHLRSEMQRRGKMVALFAFGVGVLVGLLFKL